MPASVRMVPGGYDAYLAAMATAAAALIVPLFVAVSVRDDTIFGPNAMPGGEALAIALSPAWSTRSCCPCSGSSPRQHRRARRDHGRDRHRRDHQAPAPTAYWKKPDRIGHHAARPTRLSSDSVSC